MRMRGESKQEIMNDLNKLLAELTGELDSKRSKGSTEFSSFLAKVDLFTYKK